MTQLTTDEIEAIATRVSRASLDELVRAMGYDPKDKTDLRRLGDDMRALSEWRRLSQRVGSAVLGAIVTTMTGAIFIALWQGAKALLSKPLP